MGCLNSKAVAEKAKTSGDKGSDHRRANNVPKNHDKTKAANNVAAPKAVTHAAAQEAKEDGKTGESDPAKATQGAAEQFLRTIMEGTERFITGLPDTQAVKQVIMLTFTNSCAEVTRTKFRMKLDAITDLIASLAHQLKLPLMEASVAQVEERAMDDGFSRILLAWFWNNPTCTKKIPVAAGQAVLDTLYIRYVVNKPVAFEDILADRKSVV